MSLAQYIQVEMAEMICGECGIHFMVPERWRADKQRTGKGWYCPNGHGRVYRESDLDKAKSALAAEKERHQQTLSRLNKSEAAKQKAQGEIKRIKKRAAAGVCPCCNRTFQQLARHMKTKHPDYK